MPLSPERIDVVVGGIGRARVLILGDIMLDEYLIGVVERISPEAPVPVVEISSDRILLGGAANVAANIRALGDEPLLMGAVGDDVAAERLRKLLTSKGISDEYLIVDRSRQTTIKTRVIAHSQQVVRADREDRHDLSENLQAAVMERLESMADSLSALIVSDYGKGVIAPPLLKKVISFCNKHNIFVAVDPKETNFHNYLHVSLVTPNHHEASFAYGRKIRGMEDLLEVGGGLLERLDAQAILITRGAEGMSLFQRNARVTHIPTFARHVYDVTGAGDTVIAVFVSAVSAGANMIEAAIVANAGAGKTVAEVGTATVDVESIREELQRNIKDGMLAAVNS